MNNRMIKMSLLEATLKHFILISLKDLQKRQVHHSFKKTTFSVKVSKNSVIVNFSQPHLILKINTIYLQKMNSLFDQKVVKTQIIKKIHL